jgi:hypothetical protein
LNKNALAFTDGTGLALMLCRSGNIR